jgi:hypothetical protein
MEKLAAGQPVFDTLDENVDASIFLKSWRINSTLAKATICMLAQLSPVSFLSGSAVDLGTAMAAYNSREFHHIYPKGYLAGVGILFHESNVIANICFLTSADNREISDSSPSDYMMKIPAALKAQIAESALIPLDALDGSKPYGEFLLSRAKALATIASKLIATGSVK